jgi:hypothetical protein
MAQVAHVVAEFSRRHPVETESTPNLVVLSVCGEAELLARRIDGGVTFHEPDVGDEATAFCVIADGRRFADLPLAGRAMA